MPVHLTSTVSRIVGLLPGTGRTNPVPPSIRFDTAIGEGLTPAGASRDQRLALVRRHPPLRCDLPSDKADSGWIIVAVVRLTIVEALTDSVDPIGRL